MKAVALPLILGLLLGLTLHWAGFSRPGGLRDVLALRRRNVLRTALYALGVPMVLTALLCWLAVIDVDGIVVLPLTPVLLAGAVLYGVAAGLTGCTPLTAFALLGSGYWAEALCTLAGCTAAALLLHMLQEPLAVLRSAVPLSDATLFRMTLDEPFLLGGGFAGQACAGFLLMAIGICILPKRTDGVPAAGGAPADAAETGADPLAEDPAVSQAEMEDGNLCEMPGVPEGVPDSPLVEENGGHPDGASGVVPPDDPEQDAAADQAAPSDAPKAGPPEEAAPLLPAVPPELSAAAAASAPQEFLILPSPAPEDAFVALLPGEEPLIVDMLQEEDDLLGDVLPEEAERREE